PLPLCIALSLSAQAADERPEDWRLCPIEDAVPAFAEAPPTDLTELAAKAARATADTDIEGDTFEGSEGNNTVVQGNVALTRGDQFLGSDKLTYDTDKDSYIAQGNVRYQDNGLRIVADRAEGDQDDDVHRIENIRYQLMSRRGNGRAERVEITPKRASLFGSTYSTCDPGQRRWELRAQRIDIDTVEGMGVARNATLRIGRVPVLYVPWFMFPTDDRRRTGLLYPSIGSSSRNGFDWRQPIYLNLAPNYDMTLTPRLMSSRGLMLGSEFRYMYEQGGGTLEAAFLPSDRLTSRERQEEIDLGIPEENRRDDDRGMLRFRANHNFNTNWRAGANLQWVSDTRYLEDFSNTLDGVAQSFLLSDVGLYGHGRYWTASLSGDYAQLTDYRLTEFFTPYTRLPRALLSWEQPVATWFRAGVDAEAVRFAHPSDARDTGSRIDLKPFVSMPLEGGSWFVTPKLAWRHTAYQVDRAPGSTSADSPSRSLPIASLDAGVFFDRDTVWRGTSYLQTLEPRLFYLRVPYREQNDIPLFDTTPTTFSWGQLFRDNRYTGPDRQTDANQLTLAMTSRLVRAEDGREKLSASFGQIRYFEDSRVVVPGETPVERGKSGWIADMNYAPNDRWNIGATYQWDPKFRRQDLASLRTRYLIGDDGIVNFSYRYRRNLLEQV
ncbi:MAG TPA: LPS assembly protein LptD, partial [Xanthomonadaceae bacterium]|nr:LPS assembly protein LptD [Xanthomonadaceae bacterium]